MLTEALRLEGYLVAQAPHGRVALHLLEEIVPQGMLVDINMPVMSGPALLREMQRRSMQLPCIIVTAQRNAMDQLASLPVDAVIAKPFDLDELLATVVKVCGPAETPRAIGA